MSDREEIDCRSCKRRYQDCPGKPFYTVEDIRWCPYQVIWLIEEFFELTGDGITRTIDIDWPMLEFALPSVDNPRAQSSAYFTRPVEIIAELHWRLDRLGRSGELLLAELQAGMEGNLTDEAKAAFYYITGNRRKKDPYYKWKKERRYRERR